MFNIALKRRKAYRDRRCAAAWQRHDGARRHSGVHDPLLQLQLTPHSGVCRITDDYLNMSESEEVENPTIQPKAEIGLRP